MKNAKLAVIALAAGLLALTGCAKNDSELSNKIEQQGQEIINETITKGTADLVSGKSMSETGKNALKNAKESAKKGVEKDAKKVDKELTGGIGSAIYEGTKNAK